MPNRRHFLRNIVLAGSAVLISQVPGDLTAAADPMRLCILHTNDQHSRIDPFPLNHRKYPGMGGFAERAAMINRIRANEQNVVLLDAGDVFQGTPYFNYFLGELEYRLMEEMGYDAMTIGNHDFDAGMDILAERVEGSKMRVVCANYEFSGTPMDGKTENYTILKRGEISIGILGVGIEPEGLVPAGLYGETRYLDPVAKANETAGILKNDHGCDIVICLSHLGYSYSGMKVSDRILAANSSDIDLILGGHTHTFMEAPEFIENRQGWPVLVNQVGWAGLHLGRIDVILDRRRKAKRYFSAPVIIDKKASGI